MNTIKNLSEKLKKREVSSVELTKSYLKGIKDLDESLNSYVTVIEEKALNQAKIVDEKIAKGDELSPVAGIPSIMKDNISIKDVRLTASSRILEDYVSPYSATVIDRLEDAVFLGKGNLDSFAFGSSTENSGFSPTHNPWDLERTPGGSSGGVSAAVAADIAVYGLGTDTGGSIRQPASLTGTVGLIPTYGRSSRYGLIAMGSSLDCPGPITKTVEDAAIVLSLIAGNDPMDTTSSTKKVDGYRNFKDIKGLKVGVPKEFFSADLVQGMEDGVKKEVEATIKMLKEMGAEIIDITLPNSIYSLPVYYIITPAEIAANMTRYDGVRFGKSPDSPQDLMEIYLNTRENFEDEVKRRIFIGNYALSSGYYDAYYNQAMKVRQIIKSEINKAFERVDIIVSPTTPTTAFKLGEKNNDPVSMYLSDIFTVTADIANIPALSIPCGLSNGLPVGFQIMGKQFDEVTILNVGFNLEQEIGFNEKYKPSILRQ